MRRPSYLLKTILLLSAAFLLLSSCSTSSSYYLEAEYEDNKTKAPVGIFVVEREQFPDLQMHSFSSMTSRQRRTFRLFLEPLYVSHANTEAWVLGEDVVADQESFRSRTFTLEENSFPLLVPGGREALDFSDRPPRFLLILDQYYYRQGQESTGDSGYAGHEASVTQVLVFQTNYAYWDVLEEEVVGYGSASAKMNLEGEEPTISEYSDVLSQALLQIVEWGPIAY